VDLDVDANEVKDNVNGVVRSIENVASSDTMAGSADAGVAMHKVCVICARLIWTKD